MPTTKTKPSLQTAIDVLNNYKHINSINNQKVTAACQDALQNNLFVLLLGETGYGKSFGFTNVRKENKYVFLKEIVSTSDPKIFNDEVVSFLEQRKYESQKLHNAIKKASNLVNQLDSKSLFIIDEAGHFKMSMHKHTRQFRDKTANNAGLIISGPDKFNEDLELAAERNVHGIRELLSRVDYTVQLDPPLRAEYIAICEVNGIEDPNLIEEMIDDVQNFRKLNKRILKYYRDLLKQENAKKSTSAA